MRFISGSILVLAVLLVSAPVSASDPVPLTAQAEVMTVEPSHSFVGSPFVVGVESVGAQGGFCGPENEVCGARCECLFPGPGGAFCIFDPALSCFSSRCRLAQCDHWPE